VEDQTFYSHRGVNVRALTRALLSNFQTGSARQGASTITQQRCVAVVSGLYGTQDPYGNTSISSAINILRIS
jgi:membrane carboxypeptidase/penicillin-binding protein